MLKKLKISVGALLIAWQAIVLFGIPAAQAGQIYACPSKDATNPTWACSSGNKSDCSDVPTPGANACAPGTCKQIDSAQCGKAVSGSPNGNPQGTPNPNGTPNGNPVNNNTTIDCSGTNNSNPNCVYNPLPVDELGTMLLLISKTFLGAVAILSVVFIIVGGFQMVTAAGSEEVYTKARKTIVWAILGLVVALLSYSIVAIVENILRAKIQAGP